MRETTRSECWRCDVCDKAAEVGAERDSLPPGWSRRHGMEVCSEECKEEMTARLSRVYYVAPGEALDFETMSIIDWQVEDGRLKLTMCGYMGWDFM